MAASPEPAAPKVFEAELGSTPQDVRGVLETVSDILLRIGWRDPSRGVVELVLAEALNNIVEHAYQEHPGGWIMLCVNADQGTADLCLRDSGQPMPNLELPAGRAQRLATGTEDLPEGGFGWYMIRRLADGLVYTRDGEVNRLDIHICRSVHESCPEAGPLQE